MKRIQMFALLGFVTVMVLGCAAQNTTDESLPTLAQLPSMTATSNSTATVLPSLTPTRESSANQIQEQYPTVVESAVYGVNAFDAPTASPLPNVTVTAVPGLGDAPAVNVEDDSFPVNLEVGAEVTLRGLLAADSDAGRGVLTNSRGETLDVLIDPFSALLANGQQVVITGELVSDGASQRGMAVRVTAITILSEAPVVVTPTGSDTPQDAVPTASFS